MQRFSDQQRIHSSHAKESQRGAFGLATSLLPVAKRPDAHPYHERELSLRLPETGSKGFDVRRLEFRDSSWPADSAADASRLAYTGEKLTERS